MADTKHLLPSCRLAALPSKAFYGAKYMIQQCSTLRPLVTYRSNYPDINTASIMGCCTPSIVSETSAVLHLPSNMLLEALPGECCRKWRSNHGVLQLLRPSIAKRNLIDKCVSPDTCQIIMTPQIPTHLPNCRIGANTRTRTISP